MTCVLRNKDTKAANKNISATARVQEYTKVSLFAKVRNVAGDAWEVAGVVFEADAANSGATVEYGLVLSARSVSEDDYVLAAPLELITKPVYLVLYFSRLLREEPVSFEQRVEAAEDGIKARLENDHVVSTFESRDARDSSAA
jgi:ribosomal 50S subunit-recycling heat shock protein